jgi:hypothetical protein
LQTSSHQQLWPNFQDPYTLFVVAPQLRLVETEATQEMDTSFRNHPHDQPQDFLLELALALPKRTVPQKEQPTHWSPAAGTWSVIWLMHGWSSPSK